MSYYIIIISYIPEYSFFRVFILFDLVVFFVLLEYVREVLGGSISTRVAHAVIV